MRRVPRWWAGKGPPAKPQISRSALQRVPRWWAGKGPAAKPQISRSALQRVPRWWAGKGPCGQAADHPLMRQSSQVSHAARYALASDIKKAGLRPPF
ncbi:hypothetical protein XhhCFBP4925_04505 [Xanthomonas hortorum pv. hederae]|nr:hypothetical protein XhhCFBP4925_04505 [Xanthomonas hortorum pv. hederae]